MHSRQLTVVMATLALVLAVGCSSQRANTRAEKENVEKALDQAGLKDVKVDLDRDKGVITLNGRVRSQELKQKAAEVAKNASGGEVIANQLSVEPVDNEGAARKIESNVDEAIEKNFKAALIANKLDNQRIRFTSKNGVLTLNGTVNTMEDRQVAEKLAASIPNVEQVVNKLDVKGKRRG